LKLSVRDDFERSAYLLIDKIYKAYCYWRQHGIAALQRLVLSKLSGNKQQTPNCLQSSRDTDALQISHIHFQELTPLRIYFLPEVKTRRVNLITDSINKGSLFAGVGTALIFAVLLANKLNAQLRVITRTERAKPENFDHLLSTYGIELKQDVEFKFAAFYDQKYQVDIIVNDLFITTSWWTTAATIPSVPVTDIIYLLQEDERIFYPFGEERLRCEFVMRNRDIHFLVNSRLLFDHLIQSGFDNIAKQNMWFEPAFPPQVFHPRKTDRQGKRRFFFYARPNNMRNLFHLGVEVIEQAITRHVLDMNDWDIFLVGNNIPNVTFCGGYVPEKYENLAWSEYAELAGTVDVGLVLMYSPHPSYPPLDLAASGAVVVTNRFANKMDLSSYSANLICADLDRDALVDALQHAIAVAADSRVREQNFCQNNLVADWRESFAGALRKYSGGA
jgi:O-antigen biosynthesis protein